MKTVSIFVCAVLFLARDAGAEKPKSCPDGWTQSNERCFIFVPTALNWATAEKNCRMKGAHLASVHSADEYHHIQAMIAKITHGHPKTWLGGSDCQNEGVWLWIDGTPFNYRHCGKFNNAWFKQHCLQMNYGDDKCWDDTYCSTRLPSICAKDATDAGSKTEA